MTPYLMKRHLVSLLILALLAGCGGAPEAQPLRLGAAPWLAGEQATYAIAANETDTTGAALFSTAREDETWILRRELRALGDVEIAIVQTGAQGFRPQASSITRTLADGGVEQVSAVYTQGTVDLELTTRQAVTTVERFNIPSDARDQRSLPFLVRSLPLAEGYVTVINTFLPVTGTLDRTTIAVVERESVQVPAGTFETWRVRLDTGDSVSHLWVGVEPPHPLVKFDDGRANATYELTEFTRGGD